MALIILASHKSLVLGLMRYANNNVSFRRPKVLRFVFNLYGKSYKML